jgi:arginase
MRISLCEDETSSGADHVDRRKFLAGSTAAAIAAISTGSGFAERSFARVYRVLGVPLRNGSLYPGNENDAQAYRDVHFIERMRAANVDATDEGNVAIPSYLPHHSVPPIRNWPGPRIAWECVAERVTPYLSKGEVPLLIGCDCSVVVGTTQALAHVAGAKNVHVIYVDGDFDDAPPEASRVNSAASVGVWLLTHPSPFWAGPALNASQVTVMGWTNSSHAGSSAVTGISCQELQGMGAKVAAAKVLNALPADATILIHFDIDVMRASEMPAAYFPHEKGMGFSETSELMGFLLKDPRVRLIEVSEYAMLRDGDQRQIDRLAELIVSGLKI